MMVAREIADVPRDSVVTNIQWMATAIVITRSVNLFFYFVLARSVGVDAFGVFLFAISAAATFAVIPDWGLNELAVREIATDRRVAAKYLVNGFLVKLLLTALTIGGITVTIGLLQYPEVIRTAVYLAAVYFFAQSCESFFFAFFRAFEKVKYEAILTTVRDVSLAIAGMALLATGGGILQILTAYAILGLVSSSITAAVLFTRFVRPSLKSFTARFIATRLTLPAVTFAIGNLLLILYSKQAMLILQYLRGPRDVGWYGAADKIIDAALIVPYVGTAGLYPAFARLATRSRPRLEAAVGMACRAILVVAIIIAIEVSLVFARPLIEILYGVEYRPSAALLQCLIWILPAVFIMRVVFAYWAAIGVQNHVNLTLVIAICLNVGGNLALVPRFGILGAAVTAVTAAAVVGGSILASVAHRVGFKQFARSITRILVGAALAGVTAITLEASRAPLSLTALLTGAVYLGALWTGRVFSREEEKELALIGLGPLRRFGSRSVSLLARHGSHELQGGGQDVNKVCAGSTRD